MLTVIHFTFYVAVTFAILALCVSLTVLGYATVALALAQNAVLHTARGVALLISRQEIEVNLRVPAMFAFTGLIWALVAVGLHAI